MSTPYREAVDPAAEAVNRDLKKRHMQQHISDLEDRLNWLQGTREDLLLMSGKIMKRKMVGNSLLQTDALTNDLGSVLSHMAVFLGRAEIESSLLNEKIIEMNAKFEKEFP